MSNINKKDFFNPIVDNFIDEYHTKTGVEIVGYRLTNLENEVNIELFDIDHNVTALKKINLT